MLATMILRPLLALLVTLLLALPARAAPCGGDFNGFLAAMAREAQGAGVSRAVIDQAFAGVTLDPAVLSFDRRQRGMFHAKSFEEYAAHPRHRRPHQARQGADGAPCRAARRASSGNSACRRAC